MGRNASAGDERHDSAERARRTGRVWRLLASARPHGTYRHLRGNAYAGGETGSRPRAVHDSDRESTRRVTVPLAALARRLLGKHAAIGVTLQAVYRTGPRWTTVRRRFTLKRHPSPHQSGPQLLAAALRRHSACVGAHLDRGGSSGRLRSLRRFFNLGVRVSCRSHGGSIDDLTFRRGVVRRRALAAAAKVKLCRVRAPLKSARRRAPHPRVRRGLSRAAWPQGRLESRAGAGARRGRCKAGKHEFDAGAASVLRVARPDGPAVSLGDGADDGQAEPGAAG